MINASINSDGRLALQSDTGASITLAGGANVLAATGAANAATTAKLVLTSTDNTDITVDFTSTATAATVQNVIDAFGMNERTTAGDITGQLNASGTGLVTGQVSINGVNIGTTTGDTAAAKVAAINKVSDQTGVVDSLVNSATGGSNLALKLDSVNGEEITIDYDVATRSAAMGGIVETNNSSAAGKTVSNIDISTAAGAQSAIDVIDGALDTINATRADLGAINNRLDFTINNLSNISQNASAARSRIEDADFAAESAALSRAQVLQQAGTAMLAQANAQPQQVLSLLQ